MWVVVWPGERRWGGRVGGGYVGVVGSGVWASWCVGWVLVAEAGVRGGCGCVRWVCAWMRWMMGCGRSF